ncbi:DsbA family protein [Plantactinospora mayteni]|uniref:DsbA family protein n=1 Tax=Plantactinospora mayteni TaxID=566021 RepID=UPI0019443420|nr:DsbA family protein [Plantactinospora mayteni]
MKIEIYADILCPWCYIGKRRLAAALARIVDRDRIQVVWRSHELAPQEGKLPGLTAAEAMAGWWGEQASTSSCRRHRGRRQGDTAGGRRTCSPAAHGAG